METEVLAAKAKQPTGPTGLDKAPGQPLLVNLVVGCGWGHFCFTVLLLSCLTVLLSCWLVGLLNHSTVLLSCYFILC